jgi:IS605 OrfB family transposase
LTEQTTSRWAGSITRCVEDQYQLGLRGLKANAASLGQAVAKLDTRIAAPVAGKSGKVAGYACQRERFSKQQRRSALAARLTATQDRLSAGHPAVVAGGRRLAKIRHNLPEAGLSLPQWRRRWDAARMFLTADGESGAPHGNYTISVSPDGVVTIALPAQLKHLANAPRGRLVLGRPVAFTHRANEWAARVEAEQSVRYDISYDPERGRWYLDASWSAPTHTIGLEALAGSRLLGVDLNADHLAAHVIDVHGNPVGAPITIPLDLVGPASQRDGRLRAAITEILRLARQHDCPAVAIENLGFVDSRNTGRETMGRGRRGKTFRRTVAGIPTAKFRERLTAMAYTAGIAVIAVDPAYTSRWGGQHWKPALTRKTPTATRHHAASVVIARRAHGLKARRRPGVTRTRPEDRARETTGQAAPQPVGVWEQIGLFETARTTPMDKTCPASTNTRHSPASKTVREATGSCRDQHVGQLRPIR